MTNIIALYNQIKRDQQSLQPSEIKYIRLFQYKMTQKDFAHLIGVLLETYRTWEQGRYKPSSPAQSLLIIARDYPEIFLKNRKKLIQLME